MCERETSGFQQMQSSWLLIVLSLRQAWELATLRYQWDRTSRFQCAVSNVISLDMARTNAEQYYVWYITIVLQEGSDEWNGLSELEGILLALKKFLALSKSIKEILIFSGVKNLQEKTFRAKNVKRFYNLFTKLPPQVQVVIARTPSNIGISGNERADGLAEAALASSLATRSHLCWSDTKLTINMYICTIWQELWNSEARNKLYEILPDLKDSSCGTAGALCRKQESVICLKRKTNQFAMFVITLSLWSIS